MGKAADWYNERQPGLGLRFCEEVFQVWDRLAENPHVSARRHPLRNIRWLFPTHFPFRVAYEIDERRMEVVILAVMHAARADSPWTKRISD